MLLNEFLEPGNRSQRIQIPEQLKFFDKKLNTEEWQCYKSSGNYYLKFLLNGEEKLFSITELLDFVLPPKDNVCKVHAALEDFYNGGVYKDGLPLYFVRWHNSSGEKGKKTRRRGWIVRYNNAYVVFMDNFFLRHFFEYSYYCSSITKDDIEQLIRTHSMPFSSGGGEFEKLHRVFPSLAHLTSGSKMYLSHVYDVNKDFHIRGTQLTVDQALGNKKGGLFGHGMIEDWDNGNIISDNKKCRVIKESLGEETLAFLKASNIRALSPLNYFPFAKPGELLQGSITGEDGGLRNKVIDYYTEKFGDQFKNFIKIAAVPHIYHDDSKISYVGQNRKSQPGTKGLKEKRPSVEPRKKSKSDEFSKEDLIEKVRGWKLDKNLLAHKVIDNIVSKSEGIEKANFLILLKEKVGVKSPATTLSSMQSNKRKQYGRVLHLDNNRVFLHPDIRDDVLDIWKGQ